MVDRTLTHTERGREQRGTRNAARARVKAGVRRRRIGLVRWPDPPVAKKTETHHATSRCGGVYGGVPTMRIVRGTVLHITRVVRCAFTPCAGGKHVSAREGYALFPDRVGDSLPKAMREDAITPDATQVVFLLDVDNTLLDNDWIIEDLRAHLLREFDADCAARYWEVFDALRRELGYADYLGALQRYRREMEHGAVHIHQLLQMSAFLIDYPFADRLYPGALDVIRHLADTGPTVVFSDGDVVFQPRKVRRSGLWDAVEGRVLIYEHKELMVAAVEQLHPSRHYVMVDDKVRLLSATKEVLGRRLTTVFPRQGHYAFDVTGISAYSTPDITVERIADILVIDPERWRE